MVRKGNGKVAQGTIGGTPINGIPPVSVGSTTSPTQTTTRSGDRWGDPGLNDPSDAGTQPAAPDRRSNLALRRISSSLSRKHGSELVSTRYPGGLAVFRKGGARIAFGPSGGGLPQAGRGFREVTGPQPSGFPLKSLLSARLWPRSQVNSCTKLGAPGLDLETWESAYLSRDSQFEQVNRLDRPQRVHARAPTDGCRFARGSFPF